MSPPFNSVCGASVSGCFEVVRMGLWSVQKRQRGGFD